MAVGDSQNDLFTSVDANLQAWRQGDCSVSDDWFAFRFDPQKPLTDDSTAIADGESDLGEIGVLGFALISQTCDVVRKSKERPFVEIAPLVHVEDDVLRDVQQGRRPRYAYIPGTSSLKLVADLDRVMTVEKAVVAGWSRTVGCSTDEETRDLRDAIARKRLRFAFPDDFVRCSRKLQERLQAKHGKQSDEGEALRALLAIRVRAEPSWDATQVELFFWFIRDPDAEERSGEEWSTLRQRWLKLVEPSDKYQVTGAVVDLEQMTARDYIESDPLDLDHLSQGT